MNNEIMNDEIIPDPFEKEKKMNLYIPEIVRPTNEELSQILNLFKELMKKSLNEKRKGYIGLPEHIIYNYLRGVPLFRGIEKLKKNNRSIYKQYGFYYGNSWASLATNHQAKEFHQKLSYILGYKYEPLMKAIHRAFSNKF